MFSHSRLVFALLSLAPLLARADLKLDSDDISSTCSSICRPVYDLSQTCDVDDDRVPSQLTEDALNLQCLCTNSSFDVAGVTALCASCMQQNPTRDDDGSVDTDDIYEDMEGATACLHARLKLAIAGHRRNRDLYLPAN